jgi:sugar phosphate isomerase/epimerase
VDSTAYRLACGDHSFPLLPHEQVVNLVAGMGLEGLDLGLMGNRSHVRPEVVRTDLAGWSEKLTSRVHGAGLEVADVFVIPWTDFETMAPNHPDPKQRADARELFTDMLELTARLGAPGMTILPGIEWPDGFEASMERAAIELAWRVEQARDRGIRFSVEPHLGSLIQTPTRALQLCEMTLGLELTLDYGHFVYQGIPIDEINELIPHSRHLHARASQPGRLQAPLKADTIPWEETVDLLRQADYDGYLAIEYVWVDWEHCNECDNVSETILLRDRLRAKFAGKPWEYTGSAI